MAGETLGLPEWGLTGRVEEPLPESGRGSSTHKGEVKLDHFRGVGIGRRGRPRAPWQKYTNTRKKGNQYEDTRHTTDR